MEKSYTVSLLLWTQTLHTALPMVWLLSGCVVDSRRRCMPLLSPLLPSPLLLSFFLFSSSFSCFFTTFFSTQTLHTTLPMTSLLNGRAALGSPHYVCLFPSPLLFYFLFSFFSSFFSFFSTDVSHCPPDGLIVERMCGR